MSSSDSESSHTCSGSLSDATELSNFEFEDESYPNEALEYSQGAEWSGMPHQDDPIADAEFDRQYRQEVLVRQERLETLEDRFQQSVDINEWYVLFCIINF